MYIITKATTPNAAANIKMVTNTTNFTVAKVQNNLKLASLKIADTDTDPMDWGELDSTQSKPPREARRPRKQPYDKPEAVKRLERETGGSHRDDTANGLTRCIIAYLQLKGWQAERINTTGIPTDTRQVVTDITGRTRTIGSVQWRRSGSTVGSADISATIRGRSVKIEVKIGKDRQSEAQRRYQRSVEDAGGLYYIARNFTDFWRWYQQTFVQKGGKDELA